ncbi:unnamed protein product [Blepharisma stoltei]|uniref:Uncharacterized protein n=1 Tax=Blepharisma stoltei TaxID=1481888 RepID=A0AAU9IZM3_9CILI|nr:unnamed protein product [Blepharisma stoltei]
MCANKSSDKWCIFWAINFFGGWNQKGEPKLNLPWAEHRGLWDSGEEISCYDSLRILWKKLTRLKIKLW